MTQAPRSRIRARHLSLSEHRPKLTQKFSNKDYHDFLTTQQGSRSPSSWARTRKRLARKMIAGMVPCLVLMYIMDSAPYRNNDSIDFTQDINIPGAHPTNFFEGQQGNVPQLRGETNVQNTKERYNRAVDDQPQQYVPVNRNINNHNNRADNVSPQSNIYDSLVKDVSELIKQSSKTLEEMKMAMSFDDATGGSKEANLSSGLRPSPGAPLPLQEFELERKRKYSPSKHLLSRVKTAPHQISGLNCALYGGPNSELATRDIVYWEDVASDNDYVSPFFYRNKNIGIGATEVEADSLSKYITFEPDPGGFNNNRMAFEMYVVLSAAMGRTLVLPPKHRIPLLNKGAEQDQILSMEDFFHLDSMNKEHAGVNIITMEEFLRREASSGHFTRYASDEVLLPPHGQTNWDVGHGLHLDELWTYLRTVGYRAAEWNNGCVGAFPKDASGNDVLMEMMTTIIEERDGRTFPGPLDFQGRPVSHHSPPIERLREILSGRKKLCVYTNEMQSATLVHFPSGKEAKLFMQFYSFLFFEDVKQATWSYRLIRDHLRYKDVIMCGASRIIEAIGQKSTSPSNPLGRYHSIHLRRSEGKFQEQYKESAFSSKDIVTSLSSLEANSTLFISSDENRDHSLFTILRKKYNVIFLHDFQHLLEGLNPNLFGMIEQLIAARSHVFFGTYYSTFSGFICRLRGYYAARDQLDGNEEGKLINTFYINKEHTDEYSLSRTVQKPFFAREFPVAWTAINKL